MALRTFAAIDVGSYDLELGIYEIAGKNRIRKIDHLRHVIALGNDTYQGGKISYELVDELCRVLADFVRVMKSYQVTDYRAYATSAMREARNSRIILDQVKVRTGITVRIISNSEQRFLSYKAIAALDEEFDENIRQGTAIVDVGNGSMQISLFDKNLLISTENLPLGVLRINSTLQERPLTLKGARALIEQMVESELSSYKKMYLKDREIRHLIGVGENIGYLFRYENGGKPEKRVSADKLKELYRRLSDMNEEEIEMKFGVSASYAKLLLPSAVIYEKFMELTGAEMLWLPGICLCDGMAAEYAEEHKLLRFRHSFENDIISASRSMAKRYRCKSAHSEAVEGYALQIFDATKRLHGMGNRDRLLLQIASIIHACGKFISVRNSNECGYNIIMSTEIIGLSHLEREVVANVVRYNIRDFDYNMIRMETQAEAITEGLSDHKEALLLIGKMTAILRLANSMDRGHRQKLLGSRMSVRDGVLTILTDYDGDLTLEQLSFDQKAAFYEEIFGIRPVLKQKKR